MQNCYLLMQVVQSRNLGQKVMTILHFLTHRTPILLWPLLLRHPGLSCLVGVRNDPAGLQHVFFFWGGGGGGVVVGAFKSFILKLDTVTSICPNIFAQDCELR